MKRGYWNGASRVFLSTEGFVSDACPSCTRAASLRPRSSSPSGSTFRTARRNPEMSSWHFGVAVGDGMVGVGDGMLGVGEAAAAGKAAGSIFVEFVGQSNPPKVIRK